MAHPLDLVHLRSLVAIADTRGPVVERVGRSTRFTATGERLLVEARRILAVHDDALDRLDALTGTALVIGFT